MTAWHVYRCLLFEDTAELFIQNGSFGPWVAMCNTILPQWGYATAVTFFAFDECIQLLGVFVTCHNVVDVTNVSLFTFILGFLLKLPVPLEITV